MSALFLGGLPSSGLNIECFEGGFFTEVAQCGRLSPPFFEVETKSEIPASETFGQKKPCVVVKRILKPSHQNQCTKRKARRKVLSWDHTRTLLRVANETLSQLQGRKRLLWQVVVDKVKLISGVEITKEVGRQRLAYLSLLWRRRNLKNVPSDLRKDIEDFELRYHPADRLVQ